MSFDGDGSNADEPALIPALTTQSGQHAYTTETAIHWEYAYELDAPGMPAMDRRTHCRSQKVFYSRRERSVAREAPGSVLTYAEEADRRYGTRSRL